jgi:hypothetical protein
MQASTAHQVQTTLWCAGRSEKLVRGSDLRLRDLTHLAEVATALPVEGAAKAEAPEAQVRATTTAAAFMLVMCVYLRCAVRDLLVSATLRTRTRLCVITCPTAHLYVTVRWHCMLVRARCSLHPYHMQRDVLPCQLFDARACGLVARR